MRPRDTQCGKVDAWEKQALMIRGQEMSLANIERLAARVTGHFRLQRVPGVRDGRGRSSACWDAGAYSIRLPLWARNTEVVLHELAHWLVYVTIRGPVAPHGREWLATYLYLLARFGRYDLATITTSARAAGLDFASPEACRPKGGRKL